MDLNELRFFIKLGGWPLYQALGNVFEAVAQMTKGGGAAGVRTICVCVVSAGEGVQSNAGHGGAIGIPWTSLDMEKDSVLPLAHTWG